MERRKRKTVKDSKKRKLQKDFDLEENWNSVEDPWNTVYGLSRQEQEDDEIACNNDF